MSIQVLGKIIATIGTLFIAYAALRVHHRVLKEHKIDDRVFKVMQREQALGIVGAFLLIIGVAIEIFGPLGL